MEEVLKESIEEEPAAKQEPKQISMEKSPRNLLTLEI